MLGQGVEVGVGRGVRAVVAAAPDSGDRGEQHEGVEFAVEQGVEVFGAGGLGGDDLFESGHRCAVQGASATKAAAWTTAVTGSPAVSRLVSSPATA